jgi:hypothetical protein
VAKSRNSFAIALVTRRGVAILGFAEVGERKAGVTVTNAGEGVDAAFEGRRVSAE